MLRDNHHSSGTPTYYFKLYYGCLRFGTLTRVFWRHIPAVCKAIAAVIEDCPSSWPDANPVAWNLPWTNLFPVMGTRSAGAPFHYWKTIFINTTLSPPSPTQGSSNPT